MKKILIIMITATLMLNSISCKKADINQPIKVTYFSSIGAYLDILKSEIDRWNSEEGAEKGVYIELTSNIDNHINVLNSFYNAGKHFNFTDLEIENISLWTRKGLVKNLWEIDNPELKELIESYKPYLGKIVNSCDGSLSALPLEVVPIKFAVNTDLFAKNNLGLPKTWGDILNAARIITENGNGQEFGFGWSTWIGAFTRLALKASMNSTGKGWWDPNTSTYSFSQFKVPIEALATMYKNG